MQKQLTKQVSVLLLASSLGSAALGQERGSALATVPGYSDDASGWVRIEVAIFTNSDAAVLSAETWEHAPTLRYPENRRWLTRYGEIKALMDEWGESAVTVNADGSVDVIPEPVTEPLIETAQNSSKPRIDGELAVASVEENTGDTSLETDLVVDSTLSIDGLETPTGADTSLSSELDRADLAKLVKSLPQDALELTDNADIAPHSVSPGVSPYRSQVSMEELRTETNREPSEHIATADEIVERDPVIATNREVFQDNVDTAAIDAVDIFNTGELTDASARLGSITGSFPDDSNFPGSDIDWLDGYAVDEEDVRDTKTIAPEEAPAALPTPYQALTVEMLKQGLDKLQQQTERAPVTALAWLQAPGDQGSPVVADTWQQASDFPIIQGTLTFTRDDESAITVDLWLNTIGDYLPPRFTAIETPSAPERILVIETIPADQEPVKNSELPEFIDLRTGLNTDGSASSVDATVDSAVQTSSPYRHAIAVSEQRDIREGYVRYIDHPTLQIVATWRELSFREVYELGESQRIRRDIDSLTRTLTAAPTPGGPRPKANPRLSDTTAP